MNKTGRNTSRGYWVFLDNGRGKTVERINLDKTKLNKNMGHRTYPRVTEM